MPGFNALKKLIKQINHHKIEDEEARVIILARLLGYPIIPRGLCNGYAHMMNQAVLVGEEDICLKRIKRINETLPEILIADINQAKEKYAKRIEELTERELIDL